MHSINQPYSLQNFNIIIQLHYYDKNGYKLTLFAAAYNHFTILNHFDLTPIQARRNTSPTPSAISIAIVAIAPRSFSIY